MLKIALKVYFHLYPLMYAPDLQGNLLKMNPSTLSIASAKINR